MNPFTHLGLPSSATAADIQAAFRREAIQCHPDLHPNDAGSARRFQQLVEARDLALKDIQGAWCRLTEHRAAQVGFSCACCGDSFDVLSTCPRCGVLLTRNVDQPEQSTAEISTEELNQLLDACGAYRNKLNLSNPIPADSRVLLSAAILASFGYSIGVHLGMMGMAIMLIGFAAIVVSVDTWAKHTAQASWLQ